MTVTAGLQNLLGAAGGAEAGPSGVPAEGHYSDTTASAPASDDEGSTAATDGSTLRTSPAEQVRHPADGARTVQTVWARSPLTGCYCIWENNYTWIRICQQRHTGCSLMNGIK